MEQLINKKISLFGWAFKKNTSDSRESPAIYVTSQLLDEGAVVHIFDPMIKRKKF